MPLSSVSNPYPLSFILRQFFFLPVVTSVAQPKTASILLGASYDNTVVILCLIV